MLMIAAILIPVAAGIVISAVPMEDRTRKILYMCSVLLTDIAAVFAAMSGETLRLSELSEGVAIIFRADTLGRCFLAVTILLYTSVLFYSFEYMKMEERIPTFYAFYLISMGALIAECFAGNLVTMYLSFEFLTLTSMPLVLHERTKEAVAAGLKYLFYSVAGAMMGLLAIFFVYHFAGNPELFVYGGFLDPSKYTGAETVLLAAVLAGIVGFGAKAGMYPLHGWLPTAHPIAPAPASALLSAMIAKGGVLAVVRLVYFSVGDQVLRGTWAQLAWMCLATLTILMGSTMAFGEENLKKRLAYSTVSQISYIMLSLSLLTDAGLRGATPVPKAACSWWPASLSISSGSAELLNLWGSAGRCPSHWRVSHSLPSPWWEYLRWADLPVNGPSLRRPWTAERAFSRSWVLWSF